MDSETQGLIERGAGPALALTHGTMMDATMFAPQLEDLGRDHRVIAYDLRARGERWQGPYTLADLAEDARELLDRLGLERCVLGGMSMGGFMALRAGLQLPERLDGLVVIGGSGMSHPPEVLAEWEAHYASVRGSDPVPADWAREELAVNFSPDSPVELRAAWTERFLTRPGDAVYWEAMSWVREDDLEQRLGEIAVPVLLVHGEGDQAVPLEEAVATRDRLPDARLVTVPGAGHAVNLEAPDAVNRAIREFVAEVTSPVA